MSWDALAPPDEPPRPALRPVPLKPGERPPQVDPAREYLLLSPTAQRANFTLEGFDGRGVLVKAEKALRGGEHALLFEGCRRFLVEGVEASGAQHGIRLRGSREWAVRKCKAHHCRIEGFINGGGHDGLFEDCDSWENGADDKGHGYYLASYGSTNITGRRLRAWKCRGTAFQANGTPDELGPRKQRNVLLEDFQAWECGSVGTPAINVMSTDGFTARSGLLRNCNGGIALFDDYSRGADPWNVTLENLTVYLPSGKYGLQVSRGTRNLTVKNAIWACQPGPVRQFVVAELLAGAGPEGEDLTVLAEVPAEEAVEAAPEQAGVVRWFGRGGEAWSGVGDVLDVGTFKSRIAGVGWQG